MMAPRTFQRNYAREVILFAIILCVSLGTTKVDGCEHFLNSTQGYLESPNFSSLYPNSKDCTWRFQTTQGSRIKLILKILEVQPHENCSLDYIALYDGHSAKDNFLGKFCGNFTVYPVIATTNKMLMVFHSDESQQFKGFQVHYFTECNYFVNKPDVYITSPNYPKPYPNLQMCIWEFQTAPGARIKLVFDHLELEQSSGCWFNFVAIYDGTTTKDRLLGKYCGYRKVSPMISSSHRMTILFYSDSNQNAKGFKVSYSTDFNSFVIAQTERNLTQYLLNTKQKHTSAVNKWGLDITKIAVPLFLHDSRYFTADNETGEEIVYELTLQLMSKLVLKKRISTKDLALFINAMTVACINPRTFFDVNIVDELRKRVDNSNHTSPFFILTLCIAGENMTMGYVQKLQRLLSDDLRSSLTEIQAMVILALQCIFKQSSNDQNSTLTELVNELKITQQLNSTIDRKDSALIIQALIATESFETNFNLSTAINSIIMDMKDMNLSTEEIYYIVPVFKRKTLLDINSKHCEDFVRTDPQVKSSLRDEYIQVQISIIIGNDMDFTRTWKIKVPSNYTFYQALENISFLEPYYKFQYRTYDGKQYVAGLAKFQNSVADDSFWFIYTKPLSSDGAPILVKESPAVVQVGETDELILWYRSRSSAIT